MKAEPNVTASRKGALMGNVPGGAPAPGVDNLRQAIQGALADAILLPGGVRRRPVYDGIGELPPLGW